MIIILMGSSSSSALQFSISLLDLEQKCDLSCRGQWRGKTLVVLGTGHANILSVVAVVDAQTRVRAFKQVCLTADAPQVIQPDLS